MAGRYRIFAQLRPDGHILVAGGAIGVAPDEVLDPPTGTSTAVGPADDQVAPHVGLSPALGS